MPEDEFEIYLTLLAKTLRLSDAQRDAIAAELRDHMEARLRELTLQGFDREDAIETALAEFGDASGLARDLTQANPQRKHIRRQLMQTSAGTLIACAAVTFVVMLLTPTNKDGQPNQRDAIAQDAPAEDKPADPPKVDWTRIQPGDLVSVSVHELHTPGTTLPVQLQVGIDGHIRYGRFFDVQVVDRSLREIEREIRDQLENNRFLRRAAVTVLLSAKPSKPFAAEQVVPGEFMRIYVWEFLVPGKDSIFGVQIDQDGTISLGRAEFGPVQVEGESLREIERRIAQAIKDSNTLKDPLVRVIHYVDGRAEPPRLQTGPGAGRQFWQNPPMGSPLSTTRHTDEADVSAEKRVEELEKENARMRGQLSTATMEAMQAIAAKMFVYAGQHDNQLPTKPSDLRETMGWSDFIAPFDYSYEQYDRVRNLGEDKAWEWIDKNSSYLVRPGKLYDQHSVILETRNELQAGWKHRAFGDGHIEWGELEPPAPVDPGADE